LGGPQPQGGNSNKQGDAFSFIRDEVKASAAKR
jgi:hypothetical protein